MAAATHSDMVKVISKCRDNNCLLLVLVFDDGNYDKVTAVWNSEEMKSVIGAHKCETLELSSGSLECTNFAKLYPVLVTPSIFIINNDGIPLDILYGDVTAVELTRKINKAVEAHKNGRTNLLVTKQQQSLMQRNSNTTVRSARTTSAVVNNRRSPRRDKINNSGILQQTNSNSGISTSTTTGGVHRRVHIDSKPMAKPVISSTTCRLQLKVVNSNNKLIQQFSPSDTLSIVKECASKELGIPLDAIILEKSYPAYRFGVEDDTKSLTELQLTPTAMLIVKQQISQSWSYLMLSKAFEILFYLLSLIMWPLKLLSSFVFGSSANGSSSSTSHVSSRAEQANKRQTRRTGNIASFKQSDDDDDDQNTYNGNSTQQQ